MGVEVSQHVGHSVEPQVVDVALPVLIHRQAQMLGGSRRGGETSLGFKGNAGEVDGKREGGNRKTVLQCENSEPLMQTH